MKKSRAQIQRESVARIKEAKGLKDSRFLINEKTNKLLSKLAKKTNIPKREILNHCDILIND